MESLVIEIKDKKALKILQNLENLNIIKVLRKSNNTTLNRSEKYDRTPYDDTTKELNELEKISEISEKKHIIDHLREGFEEMKLIKSGLKKGTPLKEFLNEL